MMLLSFSDKLFSLAHENEEVKALWYNHGAEVRRLHPDVDTKNRLALIVKAIWQASQRDSRLYSQASPHLAS
jgi:hypothetical protein